MARQIGFHIYSVRIRKKYQDLETLSSLLGRQDAHPLFEAGIRERIGHQRIDEAAHRTACFRRCDVDDRDITGLIEAGHFGQTATIVHAQTGETAHRQRLHESSLLPCFFRLSLPLHANRGLLILQRDNRVPAKQSLELLLNDILYRFDNDLVCALFPIANRATFERLVGDGEVQELRFVRLMTPEDLSDAYDRNGRIERPGTAELIYRARRGAFLPLKRALRRIAGGEDPRTQFEFPDFPFDRIKAKIRIGSKLQTVDFGRGISQPIIDVTDQVELEPRTGHPIYESLVRITREMAENEDLTAYGE